MSGERTWVNPIGGLGDTLMISGALKLAWDREPERRFNLVRRTKYWSLLEGHPAIDVHGAPPVGARLVGTDYWSEPMGAGEGRAFQILARRFGLATPVPEVLYLPREESLDPVLERIVPWADRNVLVAPASDSPRKEMHPVHWERVVALLRARGCLVLQAGRLRDVHVRGAYSLLGVTTPRQLVALVRRCQLVVTSDSFVMHAAHLAGVPAVVLWGPTDPRVYGYARQRHLAARAGCPEGRACIGPNAGPVYSTCCHLGPERHCMNQIGEEPIVAAACELLERS